MDSKGDKFYDLGAIKKSLSAVAMNGAPNKTEQSEPKDRETSDSDWDTISESEESDWINESIEGDTESDSDEAASPREQLSWPMVNEDWADELRSAMICTFKLQPGLKTSIGKTPVDFFNKLFTPQLFEFLVNNINNYMRKAIGRSQGQATPLREVTEKEFYVFFGLFLNIATLNTNIVEDFWRTDHIIENPEEYMTEGRFKLILKSLNFEHLLPDNNGRSSKIAHMINYFNIIMKTLINPERILCVAESIQVPCHEHIHLLTDEFGLAHKLLVSDSDDKAGPHIAKSLLDDKLDFGHSVYMNDGFTSIGLANFLLEHKTYVTGPLKRKGKGIPSEVIEKQLRVGEKITKYNSDGISLTKFKEYNEKITMSTEHSGEWQETIDKHKVTSKKPASVLAYRKYKRGIDKHEEMMGSYYYEIDSKHNKYKRIGLHILQMLVLNAYIMYNKYGEKPLLMIDFRTVVTKYLLSRGHVRGSTYALVYT